jgi:hypothetical protein
MTTQEKLNAVKEGEILTFTTLTVQDLSDLGWYFEDENYKNHENFEFDFTKNFTARVEIADLENRGWDFTYLYESASIAKNLSLEDAEKYDKENYCVLVKVNENGGTSYYMCQKAHYGNECFGQGDTGDDSATIEDLKTLFEKGLLWDCEQTA